MMESEFNSLTYKYMVETDIDHRKSKGQYFTPQSVRERLLEQLPQNTKNLKILDPACGTGEFLLSAKEMFKNPMLFGWDIEKKLVDIASQLVPKAKLEVKDTLAIEEENKFDLVIGNPPYYEFSPSKEIKKKFGNIISGRTNIFSLFVKLGLDLLKEGGYLAYVIPPSMNNGAYFSKLRKHIVENANIEYLEILDDTSLFHKALQMTMLLVLRKGENKGDYLFEKNGIMIFTTNSAYLEGAFSGKTCLRDLGFNVRTGRLVWNQNKELLTDDPSKGIPLIWAHNITEDGLVHPMEHRKPQYVRVKDYDVGPAVAVNRITGAAKSAKIKAALIPRGMKFIAENHCNIIFPPRTKSQAEMSFMGKKKRKKLSLEGLIQQLKSTEKLKVMQNITGNTQVSKTELERLFPIDM